MRRDLASSSRSFAPLGAGGGSDGTTVGSGSNATSVMTRSTLRWLLRRTSSSAAPALMSLARGIQADLTAVLNGLTFDWSTGPVEGHVTRTKLYKRQGY